ncbi:class I SAM-dependent methyltransferase [Leifsonia kafniensis]|uniref:Class I SAM-dependent methyltransferase n=1 Tax=Leifsonia kafniensis TaxID=475957 RepID=A0ABP7K8C2_9MICO
MQEGRLHAHADSFKAGADGYDAHRPSYPREAVAWLVGHVGVAQNIDVADIGAGTGKLTGLLLELGAHVVAVDPSADMLRVLHQHFPAVRAVEGSGERIPLPDSSVDLVTFAQAWHWVDIDAASAEVLRVLRPGGRLALIWNSRDESVPWVRDLSRAMNSGQHAAGAFKPIVGAGLAVLDQRVDRWVQETTRDGIRSLVTTRSYYLVASVAEKETLRRRVDAVLDAHPETREDPVHLPYLTEIWIAAPTSRADS